MTKNTDKTKLILKDNKGKKVVYEKKNLTAGDVMKAYEYQEQMYKEGATDREQLETLIEFNVSLFDNEEVTRESILAGIPNNETYEILYQPMFDVLGIDPSINVEAVTDEKK